MLNETLGKVYILVILNWFPFNILYPTFLRFNGECHVVYLRILPDQGWDTANLISTIGALLMAIGVIIFVNQCYYYIC